MSVITRRSFLKYGAGTNAALGLAWTAQFSQYWCRGKTYVSRLVELSVPSALIACSMIYRCIRYIIDGRLRRACESGGRPWWWQH